MVLPFSVFVRPAGRRPVARERLFVALWPDASTRANIAQAATRLGIDGRRVAAEDLHLTLVFLGQVDPARRAFVVRAMRETRARAFDLALDRSGYFSASRVAWLGPSVVPAPLGAMRRRLTAHLRGRGFVLEDRAFRAHVTLARDAARPAAAKADCALPVSWRVASMALVRSQTGRDGARYDVVEALVLQ